MTVVVFYEKPGCVGNARQKRLLEGAGHRLDVRNLLAESWTPQQLRAFFGNRPVAEWFNQTAPRVKSGEIEPKTLSESEALQAMIADPILIRRPLIQTDRGLMAGFDSHPVLADLGLELGLDGDLEGCPKVGHLARISHRGVG